MDDLDFPYNHRPATKLPWASLRPGWKNRAYALHAANNYHKLVDFLHAIDGACDDKEASKLARAIMAEIDEAELRFVPLGRKPK